MQQTKNRTKSDTMIRVFIFVQNNKYAHFNSQTLEEKDTVTERSQLDLYSISIRKYKNRKCKISSLL